MSSSAFIPYLRSQVLVYKHKIIKWFKVRINTGHLMWLFFFVCLVPEPHTLFEGGSLLPYIVQNTATQSSLSFQNVKNYFKSWDSALYSVVTLQFTQGDKRWVFRQITDFFFLLNRPINFFNLNNLHWISHLINKNKLHLKLNTLMDLHYKHGFSVGEE